MFSLILTTNCMSNSLWDCFFQRFSPCRPEAHNFAISCAGHVGESFTFLWFFILNWSKASNNIFVFRNEPTTLSNFLQIGLPRRISRMWFVSAVLLPLNESIRSLLDHRFGIFPQDQCQRNCWISLQRKKLLAWRVYTYGLVYIDHENMCMIHCNF